MDRSERDLSVTRRRPIQPIGWPLFVMIGTVAACSLLAPDDDELLTGRGPSGGNKSDSGTEGAGAGGTSGGSAGASSGASGTSGGSSGAGGAGGSSGAGESGQGGFGGSAGF